MSSGAAPLLLLHFGMTGSLAWATASEAPDRFARVRFGVGRGWLDYCDQRKLRGLWLVEERAEIEEVTGLLGPDALDLGREGISTLLAGRKGAVKSLLMDQRVVAGLGNMLSDEIVWRARIHPARQDTDLSAEEQRALDRAFERTVQLAAARGAIPRDRGWLSAQRSRPTPHCPRGHGPLQRERIAGRSSYWCPICQGRGSATRTRRRGARGARAALT